MSLTGSGLAQESDAVASTGSQLRKIFQISLCAGISVFDHLRSIGKNEIIEGELAKFIRDPAVLE